jgi:hypothetical protein
MGKMGVVSDRCRLCLSRRKMGTDLGAARVTTPKCAAERLHETSFYCMFHAGLRRPRYLLNSCGGSVLSTVPTSALGRITQEVPRCPILHTHEVCNAE